MQKQQTKVEAFKALGEYAMLPAVGISKMVKDAVTKAAEAEAEGDMERAYDELEWAEFLEKEMML